MTKDLDSILDEMGAEIRGLRQEIIAQDILCQGFKKYIKSMEKENEALKLKIRAL